MTGPILELSDLTLELPAGTEIRRLLDGVGFTLQPGEALGLVGESGSGKSLTLRTIARLLPPGADVSGSLRFDGADITRLAGRALRGYRTAGVGVIFQDPRAALDPLQRICSFLIEPALVRGTATRRQAFAEAEHMLSKVGITDPRRRLMQYPHQLSGGMLQRVMIASVLLARPRLILADEPTTALDVTTQADVLALLDRLRHDTGAALVFVTHDLPVAMAVSDRIAVMYAGAIQEIRPADRLMEMPLHPYTEALLASRPDIAIRHPRLPVVPGQPVSAFEAPAGCVYAPRCSHVVDRCRRHRPELAEVADGAVRCDRLAELHPFMAAEAHP